MKGPYRYSYKKTLQMIEGTLYYPARCPECGSRGPSNMVMREEWSFSGDVDVYCSTCDSEKVDEWNYKEPKEKKNGHHPKPRSRGL